MESSLIITPSKNTQKKNWNIRKYIYIKDKYGSVSGKVKITLLVVIYVIRK